MDHLKEKGPELQSIATTALLWVVCAGRKLSMLELRHALAVDLDETEIDPVGVPTEDDILTFCHGVVRFDQHDKTIGLLAEYSKSNQEVENVKKRWFPDADDYMARVCIAYLSQDGLKSTISDLEPLEDRLLAYPLYDYAVNYWTYHVRCVDSCPLYLLEFLRREDHLVASLRATRKFPAIPYDQHNSKVSRVHLAAYFGWDRVLKGDLTTSQGPNVLDTYHRTPLMFAVLGDSVSAVRLLLASPGIDVNTQDTHGRTALSLAVMQGHNEMVRLLLLRSDIRANLAHPQVVKSLIERADLDINTQDETGNTPLIHAAKAGYSEVVAMLLKRSDLDINKPGQWSQTALHQAALAGQEVVVALLLMDDKVVHTLRDDFGQTVLHHATHGNSPRIIQQVLSIPDVDPNAKDQSGVTPLHLAVNAGNLSMVNLLLANANIDVNSKNNEGQTPLHGAVSAGHEPVVRALLAHDKTDPNTVDSAGWAPLHYVANQERGDLGILRCLLQREDLKVNLPTKQTGQTVLHKACHKGFLATVELLLAYPGIDPNCHTNMLPPDSPSERSKITPLHEAVQNGHFDIVKLLLKHPGVDCNARDAAGRTAVHHAVAKAHLHVLTELVQTPRVDVNAKDGEERTPLFTAVTTSLELEITRASIALLIALGADLEARDKGESTVLMVAIVTSTAEVVAFLLEMGANPNVKNKAGWTPLARAARMGELEVVDFLLHAGADAHAVLSRPEGRTALAIAAKEGHEAVVRLLLADPRYDGLPQAIKQERGFAVVASKPGGPEEEVHGKAVALFNFQREHDNELALVKGQIIWISYRHGQGWLVAEDPKTKQSGLVPEEYVRLLRDDESSIDVAGEPGDSLSA